MKKYTKPETFFTIIIILISLIFASFLEKSLDEYLPKTNFFGETSFEERHQGNIFRWTFLSAFTVYISFLIFFIITIFKKRFVWTVFKSIFEYPWKPQYSFWLFFLIGIPILWSLVFFIADAINYFIYTNFGLSSGLSHLISIILVLIIINAPRIFFRY